MIVVGLLFFLASQQNAVLIRQVAASGRVLELATPPSKRLAPPAADRTWRSRRCSSFRFFEGKRRHRFGDLDLVIDDAGH